MKLSDLLILADAHRMAQTGEARQLRVSAGLTQDQVGAHCGVTGTAVAHWETAARKARGRPGLLWARLLRELKARGVELSA